MGASAFRGWNRVRDMSSRHVGTTGGFDHGRLDDETEHYLGVLDASCQEMCVLLWTSWWGSGHTCLLL